MRQVVFPLVLTVLCLCATISSFASESHLLKAKVADIDGRPVAGAKLFLYDSPLVRRPADFISSLSSSAGQVQVLLPPGKYWAVARYKADGKYGPLLPGDKHSGEPLEVDLSEAVVEADFTVADIRELGQKKRAGATDAVRLKGRVLDAQGAPVAHVLVFASKAKEPGELPDFVSAWTEDDGGFEVYVPGNATYFVGMSRQFPLRCPGECGRLIEVECGKIDIAIDINLAVQ